MQGMSRYSGVHVLFIMLIKNISLKICKLTKIKHWDIPLVVGKDDEILKSTKKFWNHQRRNQAANSVNFQQVAFKKNHIYLKILEWSGKAKFEMWQWWWWNFVMSLTKNGACCENVIWHDCL